MIAVALFTYRRPRELARCLETMRGNRSIAELLVFNDDETAPVDAGAVRAAAAAAPAVRVFNPSDFGYTGRAFRKHRYMNRAVDMITGDRIFFTDDDARFSAGAIDLHDAALDTYHFAAGAIVRDRLFGRRSRTILQGTNYSFRTGFFKAVGGYDEAFGRSMGGGDAEFWYRIHAYATAHATPVCRIPDAVQTVTGKSTRRGAHRTMDPRQYIMDKHGIRFPGPLYRWFPGIRDKKRWMAVYHG